MPKPVPCAIVIFGASGDLAQLKLIPAVYELCREGLVTEKFVLVGYARTTEKKDGTKLNDQQYRKDCYDSIKKNARHQPIDEAVWAKMEQNIFYMPGAYDSPDDHARLSAKLKELDKTHETGGNRLFYISTPPEVFEGIIQRLGERAIEQTPDKPAGWQRIIIEKPFGRDLESARHLNTALHEYFDEKQVFRIDHYLGKETVQNLMVMRFANSIFEPIWNYKYIDHVQITVSETLGADDRAGYYDKSGATRDMIQNHIFQLMALVAMEPPAALDATSIRDEKVKVYKSIRPLGNGPVDAFAVRGQYAAGEFKNKNQRNKTAGYVKARGVAPGSTTETFVAMKLFIDNWRWSGMPFYLRTGKCLPEKLSELVVRFRSPPLTLFQKQCDSPVYPNDLVIRVQPEEGISWRLNGKVPGGSMLIKSVALDFLYKTAFNVEPPEAYERLLYDALLGDQTLFIRGDEAEAAWQVIDPIEQAWAKSKTPPYQYAPDTWGPKPAMDLIELDGRRWLQNGDGEEPVVACSL
ncbi:MAG: glucose-6-phosphate dehydrogenase [Planctomycetota bacterium]|nr:glucose-6-phosphate dehydrogenase [Planctomycetota bacterium]